MRNDTSSRAPKRVANVPWRTSPPRWSRRWPSDARDPPEAWGTRGVGPPRRRARVPVAVPRPAAEAWSFVPRVAARAARERRRWCARPEACAARAQHALGVRPAGARTRPLLTEGGRLAPAATPGSCRRRWSSCAWRRRTRRARSASTRAAARSGGRRRPKAREPTCSAACCAACVACAQGDFRERQYPPRRRRRRVGALAGLGWRDEARANMSDASGRRRKDETKKERRAARGASPRWIASSTRARASSVRSNAAQANARTRTRYPRRAVATIADAATTRPGPAARRRTTPRSRPPRRRARASANAPRLLARARPRPARSRARPARAPPLSRRARARRVDLRRARARASARAAAADAPIDGPRADASRAAHCCVCSASGASRGARRARRRAPRTGPRLRASLTPDEHAARAGEAEVSRRPPPPPPSSRGASAVACLRWLFRPGSRGSTRCSTRPHLARDAALAAVERLARRRSRGGLRQRPRGARRVFAVARDAARAASTPTARGRGVRARADPAGLPRRSALAWWRAHASARLGRLRARHGLSIGAAGERRESACRRRLLRDGDVRMIVGEPDEPHLGALNRRWRATREAARSVER